MPFHQAKCSPNWYEGDPEAEVRAAICHNVETYGSIQTNREDDEYHQ